MERLRAIADAHYRASPPAAKALAYEFFKTLDSDGDGRVSINEFLSLMKEQGHVRLANPYFFRELDSNGNGSLDFWEVLTLYYIVKSGRPVCECCGILVHEIFFSCVECFDSPGAGAYSLCIHCYRSNKSDHNHGGRQQFLDTFTLLETKKRFSANGRSAAARPADLNHHHHHHHHHHQQSSPHTAHATQVVYHSNRPQPQPWTPPPLPPPQMPDNHHHAIVPATHMEMWKTALATLEVGLSIGTISTTLCTIL